jgi:hypothetical protein
MWLHLPWDHATRTYHPGADVNQTTEYGWTPLLIADIDLAEATGLLASRCKPLQALDMSPSPEADWHPPGDCC